MSGIRAPKDVHTKTGVRRLYDQHKSAINGIEIAFFLQDWSDAYNVGGVYRVADSVGATQIFASGKTPVPPDPQVSVTSLGHHRRIPMTSFAKHDEAVEAIQAQGYALVGIELTPGALCYTELEWPDKVCLVLGNEQQGTYNSVLRALNAAVYIPQYGKGRSMNVHVSAAVVAYHVRMLTR